MIIIIARCMCVVGNDHRGVVLVMVINRAATTFLVETCPFCFLLSRMCVASRHIFQELNTLLARLGAPNYRRSRNTTSSATTRGALITSQLDEFLDSMANECDEKMLRSIKAKEIFYRGGYSRAGNPVYYWIARKFR